MGILKTKNDLRHVHIVFGCHGRIGALICESLFSKHFIVIGIDLSSTTNNPKISHYFPLSEIYSDGNSYFDSILNDPENLLSLYFAQGSHELGLIEDITPSQARNIYESNFFSAFDFMAFILRKKPASLTVLSINSIVALHPLPYSFLYSSSKRALQAMFESLMATPEYKQYRFHSIIVGNVNTGFNEKHIENQITSASPLGLKSMYLFSRSTKGMKPEALVDRIVRISLDSKESSTVTFGVNAKLVKLLSHLLGSKLLTKVISLVVLR